MLKTGLYQHWPIVLILFITAAAYSLGLDSRFLLDDFPNLASLEDVEARGYLYYLFTNNSGPSGRPVSLLSFALQHGSWPYDPQAFKAVNLIIHLSNGILIYLIILALSKFARLRNISGRSFALMVSALWLMHPIHVNTVLYVVQRMALLSTFFTLGGIYVYLKFWDPEKAPEYLRNTIAVSILFIACLVLAVFSKENGILLPMFILSIEFTLLAHVRRNIVWKLWAGIFLLLPLIASTIYLLMGISNVIEDYSVRSFTLVERLMTEARVIMVYLKHLLIPHPSAFSLFHDDFSVSRGIFSPPTTFFSIITIVLVLIGSFIWRKKMPIIAFGIFWFASAHLLESTYLNLELYFEHRNYLASLGIIFIVVTAMVRMRYYFSIQRIPAVLIVSIYLAIAGVTYSEITLWSRPIEQALEWQRRSPESARAVSEVGYLYISMGDYNRAITTFNKLKDIYSAEIYPYLKEMHINVCLRGQQLKEEDWKFLYQMASEAKWYGGAPISQLDQITKNIGSGECNNINIQALIKLIILLTVNPEFEHYRAQLHELAALLNGYIGETDAAINNASQALDENPSPKRYLLKLRLLIQANRIEEADSTLKEFQDRIESSISSQMAFREYIIYYENKLKNLSEHAE